VKSFEISSKNLYKLYLLIEISRNAVHIIKRNINNKYGVAKMNGKQRTLFLAGKSLTPQKKLKQTGILCEGNKILAVGGASAFTKDAELVVYDLNDCYAVPGFIDSHIHGAGGFDSSTAAESGTSIDDMAQVLLAHGVTTFIPTVVAAAPDKMLANLSVLADLIDKAEIGARPAGIHIEGPFVNPQKAGSLSDLCQIDLKLAEDMLQAGKGYIKKLTFAPELDHCEKLIELMLVNNVQPSMGHSIASREDTMRAIDAGARNCTHLFNGMLPLHQREISLTAIALIDDRVTVELILDGRHLDPMIVDLACRCKPHDKVIGISDSNQAAGLKDGKYHIGPATIVVKDGISTTQEGTLAGTTTLLDRGWHSLMTYSHLPETDAACCVTRNAAISHGLDDRGELKPGKLADIAFFDLENNRTKMTVCDGKVVYNPENREPLSNDD
jgi:N-acetylglucosamine-6-phosphate deacetylase